MSQDIKLWLTSTTLKIKPIIRHRPMMISTCIFSLFTVIYWGFIASDRYVSEAHVIIQNTDMSGTQSVDFLSLLGNIGSSGSADQLLLRDHLLSVDMLIKLDEKLDLRTHFSDSKWDFISRMWFKNTSIELFYEYYLSRISIEYDEYAGVLIIKSEAYKPEKAYAITNMLVEDGENFMNNLAHELAKEKVGFLEKAVIKMSDRALHARQAVLDFQNKKGFVSPENATENLVGIINGMQARLSELQAARGAMLSYLIPDSPNIKEINMQIMAVEKQIKLEKARLTSPTGKTMNTMVEEYQRLQMKAEFAQDFFKSALVSLEQGRIDAARTLKKMSVLQKPTQPEYALKPARLYKIVVFILVVLLLNGIISLLIAIIRDHKD